MDLRTQLLQVMENYLQAKRDSISKHPMAHLVMNEIPNTIKHFHFIDPERYIVEGSVGKGNWAAIPWIAVMDKTVTTSTQRGYYIVYLFSEDMKRVYLTFAQGVTETPKEEMLQIKEEIRQIIPMSENVKKDDEIDLGESKKAKDYKLSVAAYIPYSFEQMPSEEQLQQDLQQMIQYYERYVEIKVDMKQIETSYSYEAITNHIYSYISGKGFYYTKGEIINLFLSLKTKPFVILSGISGTGKTKVIQWLAESVGATEKNGRFTLIPVRPDWNDGSDLLGYVDIKGEFKPGPLTKVVLEAEQNKEDPYFVLLDEMNLARVEHYFSDILSVMESRRWEDGKIVSSNLLSKEIAGQDISLPPNVYIIGTVNMDETTHPFSKKVLDRANTIEFNRVQLSHLDFLKELKKVEPISLKQEAFAAVYLHLKDVYHQYPHIVEKATTELVQINEYLQPLGAHVGYRVRDEICFYLAYNEEGQLMTHGNAFDHCLLQKILPRISGSDTRVQHALEQLFTFCTNIELNGEYDGLLDFTYAKYPRSANKVLDMLRRLRDDGFTSFWISS
ncbi:McrB family protein [Anoxybacillus sp. D401a]|uniref:McrB family protein n=1 Tax=Anoxybacillus sp. D401a TaxID=575112 RepID=UPI003D337121